MGGQLDKRMLHWQPATMLYFQLFIIVCYLANKVLLLIVIRGSVITITVTILKLKYLQTTTTGITKQAVRVATQYASAPAS